LPLHLWLPNAYTYAPHPVTVFLAACSTKVSVYLLLRFDFFVFQGNLEHHDIQFSYFLMPLAVSAIVIASGAALFEQNLKRLFAYSSVAQVGYILLGASLVSLAGLTASIVHIFNHALAKGTLFLAIACLATRVAVLRVENISGVASHMPWTMGALVVAGLSLIGIPGTAGFVSKWSLISAAFAQGIIGGVLIMVIILGSLMALMYVWRVVEPAYFGHATTDAKPVREAPPVLLTVTWAAALANLYFGLVPTLPMELSSLAAETLLRHVQ
jgi:multicomponent Na+:H+ antiporter subunit D